MTYADPFPFSIEGDGTAVHYGDYFFTVQLIDGRGMNVHADRVTTDHGVLQLWAMREYNNKPLLTLTLAIAPGHWLSIYAASVMTGDPVCIDYLIKSDMEDE